MTPKRFRDRREAGRLLAAKLAAYANRPDVIVLALPRGGVPVAYEVARALGAPLDVFVVRKLGVPGYEELAMGAVATGGARVLNEQIVRDLRIPDYVIDRVEAEERDELARRERAYRGGRPPLDVHGRTVILVDDGLATGATMRAAVKALRQREPARIIVAVPTASPETCEELRAEVDEVVCAITPEPFHAVGYWYEDFTQTTDQEVRELLAHPEEVPATTGPADTTVPEAVRGAAHRLTGAAEDYDPLMDLIGDARFVLLGEASHGTYEFYHERARITRRLIEEKGFTAVAVEADWPDAYRVNRYVRGAGEDFDAAEALADFRRFPRWMWRNTEVVDFIDWLRGHNDALAPNLEKTGFYGLDLYSLHASMKAVLQYLEQVDPDAARRARARYACFDHFGPDPQIYGFIAASDLDRSCKDQVVSQLVELRRRATEYAKRDGSIAEEEFFYAEQNARVVKNAEEYYRSMFFGEVSSWNLRDGHMVETLEALIAHLGRQGRRAKVIVWAHNSHLGDARVTAMGRRGEVNVGQLVRQEYGREAVLVGFTTDLEFAASAIVMLLVTIGPLETAAIFGVLTSGARRTARRRLAIEAVAIAGVVLVVFAIGGADFLRLLHVSIPAFQVAAGILLLLQSIELLFAHPSGLSALTASEEKEARATGEIAVFPLAIPLIAGPASITAAMLLMGQAGANLVRVAVFFLALLLALALTWTALVLVEPLGRLLGVVGTNVIARISGILLAALAVQFMFDGIRESHLLG